MIYYMNIYNAMAANQNQSADLDLNVHHVMTLIFVKLVSTLDYHNLIKTPFPRRRIRI
jgi:hypothetical protein